MPNQQLVDYIKENSGKISRIEMIQHLKDAGWPDLEVLNVFTFIDSHSDRTNPQIKTKIKPYQRWMAAISLTLGYVWIISGINKILNKDFVAGFGDFTKGSLGGTGIWEPYRGVINQLIIPHATLFAYIVQYSELGIGILLILAAIRHFFSYSRAVSILLSFCNLVGFFLMLNIILSSGMKLPWINPLNAFAPGVNVEYVMLLISLFASVSYLNDR